MDEFLAAAIEQAKLGLASGGIPIGSVLVVDGKIVGRGHNQRVQHGSAIRHAEMDCLENAGRLLASQYGRATLYSTLSPCDMCSGAVLLYKIPKVIVGEHTTFRGPEDYLRSRGIQIEVVDNLECMRLMEDFIRENPSLWNEDIGEPGVGERYCSLLDLRRKPPSSSENLAKTDAYFPGRTRQYSIRPASQPGGLEEISEMTAATKKTRKAVVDGAEHTEASLTEMKTGDIAALIAAIRGGNPPKPATKAKAVELFWKAAETLPKAPEVPDAKAETLGATTETRGTEKDALEKAPRKAKLYSVRIDGPEAVAKVAAMLPQARELAEAMSAAGRPLTMAECAALLKTKKASARPEKIVAWYFARVFRPAGILIESRDGRGA